MDGGYIIQSPAYEMHERVRGKANGSTKLVSNSQASNINLKRQLPNQSSAADRIGRVPSNQ